MNIERNHLFSVTSYQAMEAARRNNQIAHYVLELTRRLVVCAQALVIPKALAIVQLS